MKWRCCDCGKTVKAEVPPAECGKCGFDRFRQPTPMTANDWKALGIVVGYILVMIPLGIAACRMFK